MSPGEIGAMDAALGTAAEEARAIYLLGLASAGQVPDEGDNLSDDWSPDLSDEIAAEDAAAEAYDAWVESYAYDEGAPDDGAHSFDDLIPVRHLVGGAWVSTASGGAVQWIDDEHAAPPPRRQPRGMWMGSAVLVVLALALLAGGAL